jgi:hypothetical protein
MVARIGVLRSERKMPTQKRESRRNYIGLVSGEDDEQRAARTQPQSGRPMKDYIRGLLAAVLELRGTTR